MINNTKSSITLPPKELATVLSLMKKLKAKSKVEVVRQGLELLQQKTDRLYLRKSYQEASLATRDMLQKELQDLDHLNGEGFDD